ncbi:MAG: ABC transporter substrate-binding protein [Actinomycetota bacterium]
MSRRTRGGWFVVVAATAMTLAACTGSDEPEGSATAGSLAPQEIDVLVWGDPEELEAYRQVVDGYEAAQDTVTVNLIELADRDELIARLSTSIAGGNPPDLFLLNYRYYGQFQAKSALESMTPYLDAEGGLESDRFYPEAMEAFQDGGQQTCMPQNVSSLVVYYNEDLFAEAGVKTPKEGWTWAQMVATASRLTEDADGDGTPERYGLGVEPEMIRLAPFIWSNLGTLTDEPPTRFTLDYVKDIQAMQAFFDLRTKHGVTPTDEEAEAEDFETRFLNGTLGMLMESRKVVPTFRTITDFGWDIAPLPQWVEPASILHSDAYCMTAASEHKDAAWDFLEFALGDEGQTIAAKTGRTVPSLIGVANSEAFLDPSAAPAHSQVFLDNIPLLQAVPHISTWPEIEDAANGLFEEGYYTGAEAAEVANEIIRATQPLFDRANAG